MLVTLTSRIRVHQDEVICATVQGNTIVLRFVSMKPMRLTIDDLTDDARRWLLPALAPMAIPVGDEEEEEETDENEDEAEIDTKRPYGAL